MRKIDKKENNKQPPTDPLLKKYFLEADDFNAIYGELNNTLSSFNLNYENDNISLYKLLLSIVPIEIEPDGIVVNDTQSNKIVYTLNFKTSVKKSTLTQPNTSSITGFKYICKKNYNYNPSSFPTFESTNGKTTYYVIRIYNEDDTSQIINQTQELNAQVTGMSTSTLASYYKNFQTYGKYIPNWFDNMSAGNIHKLTNFGTIFNSYLTPIQMDIINKKNVINIDYNTVLSKNLHPLTYNYLSSITTQAYVIEPQSINFRISKNYYIRNHVYPDSYDVGTFLFGKVGFHNHKMRDFNFNGSTNTTDYLKEVGSQYTLGYGDDKDIGRTRVDVSGTISGETVETKSIKRFQETSYLDTTTETYIENTPNSMPMYLYMYVD